MEHPSQTIANLIQELQADDEFDRAHASFMLSMLGTPAVQPLINLLRHPVSAVRLRASWALGVIGPAALPALMELAEGSDQELRVEAIRVLGVIGEARSLNRILVALTDSDAHVAARAARALGKIGDPRAYHPLLTALHHPSADVRYEACRSLADLHVSEASTALLELAERETEQTSWGTSVADTARRAAEEAASVAYTVRDEEFAHISKLLQQHRPRS